MIVLWIIKFYTQINTFKYLTLKSWTLCYCKFWITHKKCKTKVLLCILTSKTHLQALLNAFWISIWSKIWNNGYLLKGSVFMVSSKVDDLEVDGGGGETFSYVGVDIFPTTFLIYDPFPYKFVLILDWVGWNKQEGSFIYSYWKVQCFKCM